MKSREALLGRYRNTCATFSNRTGNPRKARHDRKIRPRNQPQDRWVSLSPQRSLPALPRLFNRSRGVLALAATISLHRLHAPD